LEDVFEELASYARRTENLERLLAARVPKPCEPSKATGENELATAVQATDWREALVVEAYPDPSATRWLCTPDRKWYWNVDEWFTTSSARDRDLVDDNAYTATARRTCTEPPNLREWWPVKADAWTCAAHRCSAPAVVRERDELREACEVANATAEKVIKERDTLRRQLATAQSDLVSMTAQRDNAVRRATAAEQKLVLIRAEYERLQQAMRDDGN